MSTTGKFSVYDDRIVQSTPAYAVYKGAESVSNTVFNAISANSSQHNFNCPVPSPNIFVDRAIDWTSSASVLFAVTIDNAAGGANITAGNAIATPLITIGKDFALSAMPLHTMTQTMTSTINDVVVSMNTAELLPQLLRMADFEKNLIQRTCPSMLDTYSSYNDGYGSLNTPLNSYYESIVGNHPTNGSYGRIEFCDPNNGNVLAGDGTYTYLGNVVNYQDGIPTCASAAGNAINPVIVAGNALYVAVRFTSTEKLILPPFIFQDAKDMSTALFGINAFQVLVNVVSQSGLQRVIRSTTENFRTIVPGSVAFAGNGFYNSKLNVMFLTPNLSLPLPPVSSVPWMEAPRYTTQVSSTILAGAPSTVVSSNNIVLPCIPDYLMIYVKPQQGRYGQNDADWIFPMNRISLNFNNFSGLMSNFTQEELYHLSMQNGLNCDWNLFSGKARIGKPDLGVHPWVATCGAPLIIKPGKDFALQSGLASGLSGNYNLQFDISVDNTVGGQYDSTSGLLLYVVAINSGFFESQGGSSRIIRAPLNETDVINAPPSSEMGAQRMQRLIGGGFFDKLSPFLSKAQNLYNTTKPIVSAVKGLLPDGSLIKNGLSAVGYGKRGKSMGDRIAE